MQRAGGGRSVRQASMSRGVAAGLFDKRLCREGWSLVCSTSVHVARACAAGGVDKRERKTGARQRRARKRASKVGLRRRADRQACLSIRASSRSLGQARKASGPTAARGSHTVLVDRTFARALVALARGDPGLRPGSSSSRESQRDLGPPRALSRERNRVGPRSTCTRSFFHSCA